MDSINYADQETIGGLNLYAYCKNNPVMNVDPTGHSWKSFWSAIGNWFSDTFGAVVESTINIITESQDFFLFGYEEGINKDISCRSLI